MPSFGGSSLGSSGSYSSKAPPSASKPQTAGVLGVGGAQTNYCPQGTTEVPAQMLPNPHPSNPNDTKRGCPAESVKRTNNNRPGGVMCCAPSASGGGIDIGSITGRGSGTGGGVGGGGGGAPAGGNVERPNLTPIDPKAEYDPEMAKSLATMRGHESNLEKGAGHSMDVLLGTQADQLEAQVAQARAAAAAQGIPFDEASFRATAMRGINSSLAQEKLGREKMLGEQYKTTGQMAGAQAGERTQRMELDYKRDVSENELLLDRYGRDIQKYGVDVQAATAANNALLAFYSQLMGGMMGMMGGLGSSQSFSNSYSYS